MGNETRIIKHGRFYNKVVRFECQCGCVFETTDLAFEMRGEDVWYAGYCPECGGYVSIKRYWDEPDDEEVKSNGQA